MPKYVLLWEMDSSRMPPDPQARMAAIMKMSEMTAQALKDKKISEWGVFVGENKGYAIAEGSWQDVMQGSLLFAPYVINKVYQAASLEEATSVIKAMMPQ
jgi:hypothetical protein